MMHLNLVPLFIQLRGSSFDTLIESRCIYELSTFCVVFYVIFGLFAEKLYTVTIRGNILLNLENDPLMDVRWLPCSVLSCCPSHCFSTLCVVDLPFCYFPNYCLQLMFLEIEVIFGLAGATFVMVTGIAATWFLLAE
ncbi:unnamed protein product [Peronospora belbahrii]|uniref:Uncharacterized protein n=1 Tax=Peronospora belbahrii TaxID=622444 RepID=A0AAU9L215_9STRA|nr:unnamed protein product [Peronospora belbahrii]